MEKFPTKKHFECNQHEFEVKSGEKVLLVLTWTPQEPGNCREMILFKVSGVYRLQTIMFGCVQQPSKPKRKVSSL